MHLVTNISIRRKVQPLSLSLALLLLCGLSGFAAADNIKNQDYHHPKQPQVLRSVEINHLGPGIEKYNRGQYGVRDNQGAYGDFLYILRVFPNHPAGLYWMGKTTIQAKLPGVGQQYFDTAMRLYPNDASTYFVYGLFNHEQKKVDKAITMYKKAIELDDNNAEYHYNLGLAYLQKNQLDDAKREADKAYGLGYPLPGLRNELKAKGK